MMRTVFGALTASALALACAGESKSSPFVAVGGPENVFEPIDECQDDSAGACLVDCPEEFAATATSDFAIDGNVDKDVWKAAKPVGDFMSRSRQPMAMRSELKLLYSERALYVGGVFHQPMETMKVEYDQHDKPIYNDDCLELFLCVPTEKGPAFLHWAVNPIGACLDRCNDDDNFETKGMEVKTRRFDERWMLEMKLPFEGLQMAEPPVAGDCIGFRVCRYVSQPWSRGAVPYLRKQGNSQRGNFGKLVFGPANDVNGLYQQAELERKRSLRVEGRGREAFAQAKRFISAQGRALEAWDRTDHPAVEKARAGLSQMRRALADYEKECEMGGAGAANEREAKKFFSVFAGFRKFVSDNAYLIWPTSPWNSGSDRDVPPSKGWGMAPISFKMASNEREAVCLDFAGLLCGARYDLRIVPQTFSKKGGFVSCDQIEIYEEPYLLQGENVITAPLVRKDGNIITLSPGYATRVWIVFNSRGVAPGEYPMTIALKSANDKAIANRELRVDVKVWNFTLPETREWPVKSFFWGPELFCNDEVQALRLMHDHHVTHAWTKQYLYRFGLTNHTTIVNYALSTGRRMPKPGELTYDPDVARTANEEFFRVARDLGMRFVIGWGTPQDLSWFRLMHERFTRMGFSTEDFVFKSMIGDEFQKRNIPTSAAAREVVFPDRLKNDWWFQAVYLSVPPPAGATIEDIEEAKLPEFFKMWTVIRGLTQDPVRGAEVVRRLKSKGCSVWSYQCSLYMQTRHVLGYYRLYPWEVYDMGLDGAALWTAGTRNGSDGFDSSDGYDDGALWIGNDRKYVTTKRFEAFREGLEDVAYVDRLEREIARVKSTGGDVARAEALDKEFRVLMKTSVQSAIDAWRLAVGEEIDKLTRR